MRYQFYAIFEMIKPAKCDHKKSQLFYKYFAYYWANFAIHWTTNYFLLVASSVQWNTEKKTRLNSES